MGKVFYDMGFLSAAKVVQCSATDLIGQYVGHTGPKVQKKLKSAMGKVLFIDEAYRLAEGHFATEAMDELVDCMTNPEYAKKMIIILAGYDKDIDRLMSMNPGLTSRFPETVYFKHMEPETCLELLAKDLTRRKDAPLDLSVITPPSPELKSHILKLFTQLSKLDSWGNARDVKALANIMFGYLIAMPADPTSVLILTEKIIRDTMQDMFEERARREKAIGTSRFPNKSPYHRQEQPTDQQHQQPPPVQAVPDLPPSAASSNIAAATSAAVGAKKQDETAPLPNVCDSKQVSDDPLDLLFAVKRDSGVSDAVWEQLERDKHTFVAREREYKLRQEEKEKEEQQIKDLIRAEKAAADEEERRQLEKQRVEAEVERRRKAAELAAVEEQRVKEKKAQRKLKELGPCPAGYMWIKQSAGYRCAGGSHFLGDLQLGL